MPCRPAPAPPSPPTRHDRHCRSRRAWTRNNQISERRASLLHPLAFSNQAWIGVEVITSYRPARDGRRKVSIACRTASVVIERPAARKVRSDTKAIVTLPGTSEAWIRLVLNPRAEDLSTVFGFDGRDACLFTVAMATCSESAAG